MIQDSDSEWVLLCAHMICFKITSFSDALGKLNYESLLNSLWDAEGELHLLKLVDDYKTDLCANKRGTKTCWRKLLHSKHRMRPWRKSSIASRSTTTSWMMNVQIYGVNGFCKKKSRWATIGNCRPLLLEWILDGTYELIWVVLNVLLRKSRMENLCRSRRKSSPRKRSLSDVSSWCSLRGMF